MSKILSEKDYKNLYLKYKVKYNKLKNMRGGAPYDLSRKIEDRGDYTTADLPQEFRDKGYFINSGERRRKGNAYRTMIMAQTESFVEHELFLQSMKDAAQDNLERVGQNPELSIADTEKPLIFVFEYDWGLVGEALTFSFGKKFAILNMANATVFGGGYSHGSAAQEEDMFRRTNVVLYKEGTRLDGTSLGVALKYEDGMSKLIDGLEGHVGLNEGVCFRDIEAHRYAFLPRERIFPFFELRSAAENITLNEDAKNADKLRIATANQDFIDLLHAYYTSIDELEDIKYDIPVINEEYTKLFGDIDEDDFKEIIFYTFGYYFDLKKKITAQLQTLKDAKIRHVVLSAFGCGAFHNPPHIVAECYRRVIESYKSDFDVIAFAIIGEENFSTFRNILMPQNPSELNKLDKKISALLTSEPNMEIPNLLALGQTQPPRDRVFRPLETTWQRIDKKSRELTDIGRDTSELINQLSEQQIQIKTGVRITFNFVEATCIIGRGLAAGKECRIRTTPDYKQWEYEDGDGWVSFKLTYSNGIDNVINSLCQIKYEGRQYRFLSAKLLYVDDLSADPEVIPLKKKISQLPTPEGQPPEPPPEPQHRPPPDLSAAEQPVFSRGPLKGYAQEPYICSSPEYQKLDELLKNKKITDMIKADIRNDKKQEHWIWWIFPLDRPGVSDGTYRIKLPQEQIPCLLQNQIWQSIIGLLLEKFEVNPLWYKYFGNHKDRWRINRFITEYTIPYHTNDPRNDFDRFCLFYSVNPIPDLTTDYY
jgi:hypothetical protein